MADATVPPNTPAGQPETAQTADIPADPAWIAAQKFEPLEVDWAAFNAEDWAKRSHELGVLNRMLQVIVSKGDEELARIVEEADEDGCEALLTMLEQFQAEEKVLRAGAASFRCGAARLMVALTRFAEGLDPAGNPGKQPPAGWRA